ncbi:hypothetical protein SSTG_05742 [Streptomyces sp. e14]|uniref:hypothetical protein n=1 Tax=Streptomyces sp. e14 TaxID=645465 RepID=UPI0001D05CD7|nr:hypothetical protein [Streptomyces sp. e14]EFF88735.1 hypothetical protein SSTG_05742 [Streptomyces sp. e14]
MHSYFTPQPPGEPVSGARPPRAENLRRAVHRAQWVLVAVNAVPMAVGVLLSCAAGLASLPVYGRSTLGIVWGILQLGVFVGSVWWYENHSVRVCDPLEQPPASGVPLTEAPGACPSDELRR